MKAYNIVLVVFWLSVIYFNYSQLKYARTLSGKTERNLIIWLQPILLIGVLLRTVYLAYPFGVFCDEAMNGYDAWCLANFGIDQHLASYPVYLKSWGTGQSALYAYLAAPLIRIFGLSTPVHRMPMAIISSVALLFFYWTFRKTQKNIPLTFIISAFLVISPWHIMKTRWALDCNISPEFVLIGICFVILAYYSAAAKKQLLLYCAGFIFIALAAYGYGVSWLMLPLLCIGLFFLLIKKKKLSIKQLLSIIFVMAVIVFPLILFALNVFGGGEQYHLGPFTITQLSENRLSETSIINNQDLGVYLSNGIHGAGRLLVIGADGIITNGIRYWGQYYNPIGILFILFCFWTMICRRSVSVIDQIFIIWLLANIPVIIFITPNINHWNLLWYPLIYFCARGIYEFLDKFRKMVIPVILIFTCMFCYFLYEYFDYYHPKNKDKLWNFPAFTPGMEDPVRFVEKHNFRQVYVSDTKKFSTPATDAPIVLFYHPIDPHGIVRVEQNGKSVLISADNYYFGIPNDMTPSPDKAYIISKYKIEDFNTTDYNVEKFQWYVVLWND